MPEDENRVLVTADTELDGKRKLDDYRIQRTAKYTVLALTLIALLVITIVVLVAIITDQQWREYAIKAFFSNLPGIAAVVLVVLGLKKT